MPAGHSAAARQVGRVSLHPARRPTQTFCSPLIAAVHSTQLPSDSPVDTERSVSTGKRGSGLAELGGTSCPPLSPVGGQWLLFALRLADLTEQRGRLTLHQHRPLQRLHQQPQPEVTAEYFG